jgi:hypothetical protein
MPERCGDVCNLIRLVKRFRCGLELQERAEAGGGEDAQTLAA